MEEIAGISGADRVRARAEAVLWSQMLAYRDRAVARSLGQDSVMRRWVEHTAVPMEIGQAAGLSETQVMLMLCAADRVREHTPGVWAAFEQGRVDASRVRAIATTINQLHRADSYTMLDE